MDEHESWAEFWSFVRTPLDNLNNFSGSETFMISMTFYIWIDGCGLSCVTVSSLQYSLELTKPISIIQLSWGIVITCWGMYSWRDRHV
jgi:hypothetical protein